MKKGLTLFLILVVLLGLLSVTATAAEEEYVYPMDSVEKLPGTIRNSDNKYVIVSGYYGAVIDLQGLGYDTVVIRRNPSAATMGYAFLCAMPTVGEVPDYAGDFYAVVWDGAQTAQLEIPDDAAYLYIYYNSNDVVFLPEAVVFKNGAETDAEPEAPEVTQPELDEPVLDASSIKVATWNIGHFSIGKNTSTKLSDSIFRESYDSYCAYLYDRIDADLITLNEYSAMFTPSYRAKDTIFGRYTATRFEGSQYRYSCNALYARLPVDGLRMRSFACNQTATINHTNLIKASDYYYLQGEITLGGESVVVVTAHLGFDTTKNPDTVCLDQIDELIRELAGYDRVLLMGDWNVRDFSYFDRFVAAGYTLGNTNPARVTCAGRSLDNIIVKGLEISDFAVHTTVLSDHYAVSATVELSYDAPVHTHTYSSVVTPPTCTQQGCTTYTCAACGDTYKADTVEAKGHVQKTTDGVAPTCTDTGLTGGAECSTCGEFLQEQSVIPAVGHSYGAWETAADGQSVRTCTVCGSTQTRSEAEAETAAQTGSLQTRPADQAAQDPPREQKAALPIFIAVTVVAAAGAFLLLRKKKQSKGA